MVGMDELKKVLEGVDPKLWCLVTAGAVWLVLWLWRRYAPGLWVAVTTNRPTLGQLPAILIGALLNGVPAAGHGVGKFIEETLVGAVVSALTAQGFHAALTALPGKYDGAQARVDAARAFRSAPGPGEALPGDPGAVTSVPTKKP